MVIDSDLLKSNGRYLVNISDENVVIIKQN